MKTKARLLPMIVALSAVVSGCATIIGDSTQLIPISSSPSQAKISITDETGNNIFEGTTPTTVTLIKSDGSYFGGKEYVVTISKEGYSDQLIAINSKVNGWYIGGNILFGGLIGWLIVDPLNGNMYTLTPGQITSALSDETASTDLMNDSSISVVLYEDVPQELLGSLNPLQ